MIHASPTSPEDFLGYVRIALNRGDDEDATSVLAELIDGAMAAGKHAYVDFMLEEITFEKGTSRERVQFVLERVGRYPRVLQHIGDFKDLIDGWTGLQQKVASGEIAVEGP